MSTSRSASGISGWTSASRRSWCSRWRRARARRTFSPPRAFARARGFYGTPTNENAITLAPIWSPDGKEIVFTATSERWNAVFAHVGYHLYRLPAAGGAEPRLVTAASGEYRDSAFAPDGKALFYKYAPQDAEIYHLERLERVPWPAGGEPTQVTRELRSRSGRLRAHTGQPHASICWCPRPAGENLYRVPAAGGTPSGSSHPRSAATPRS